MELQKYRFLNLKAEKLSTFIYNDAIDFEYKSVHFISAHAYVEGKKSKFLAETYSKGILICDSKPLFRIFRFLERDVSHIRGVDFMKYFLANAPEASHHLFLGGSNQVRKGILEFGKELNRRDLKFSFIIPPMGVNWEKEIASWIVEAKILQPNYVWIGMGTPKQFFITEQISDALNKWTFSVGAAFDFVSKVKPEAPILFQTLYLEWLFRLVTEPKRLWKRYLLGNISFTFFIAKDLFRAGRNSKAK